MGSNPTPSAKRDPRCNEVVDLRVSTVMEVVAAGPAAHVEALYRVHRTRLARLAFLITGSAEVADELAQEAFIRLWPRVDAVDDPAAYLTVTVANLARGHLRRREVERRHAPTPPGPVLAPEVDEVWSELWRLPERQRTALVLRYHADLDVAGVAEALGCRLGTAKSLLSRGVATLREVLEA